MGAAPIFRIFQICERSSLWLCVSAVGSLCQEAQSSPTPAWEQIVPSDRLTQGSSWTLQTYSHTSPGTVTPAAVHRLMTTPRAGRDLGASDGASLLPAWGVGHGILQTLPCLLSPT